MQFGMVDEDFCLRGSIHQHAPVCIWLRILCLIKIFGRLRGCRGCIAPYVSFPNGIPIFFGWLAQIRNTHQYASFETLDNHGQQRGRGLLRNPPKRSNFSVRCFAPKIFGIFAQKIPEVCTRAARPPDGRTGFKKKGRRPPPQSKLMGGHPPRKQWCSLGG